MDPASRCQRLLIVEDNQRLLRALASTLAGRASEIRSAVNVAEAAALVAAWRPDSVVLDFSLPDGNAFDVLRVIAEAKLMPALVAISGVAAAKESFQLAQLGVRAFVPKPIAPEMLENAFDDALRAVPDLTPLVRAAVGRRSVHEVEAQVRATMVSEALERSCGSLSGAARLLAISRQLLQHILKRG